MINSSKPASCLEQEVRLAGQGRGKLPWSALYLTLNRLGYWSFRLEKPVLDSIEETIALHKRIQIFLCQNFLRFGEGGDTGLLPLATLRECTCWRERASTPRLPIVD